MRHSAVRLIAVAAACVLVAGLAASSARADPTNSRALPFTWSCAGGAFEYTGIAISNNQSFTGHVIDPASSNANFIVAEVLVNGVVVPMRDGLPTGIPGLLGRPDLVTCDLIAIDGQDVSGLGISTVGFFTSSV
jgi:hypothetical protein